MQRRHRKRSAKRADQGTRVAIPPEAAPVARLQPSLSSTGTTMKHHAWISGSLALATCLLAGPVRAAPYCISNQGLLPLCIYDDPAECQQEASRQNAQCSPNTATVHLPRSHGDYCVVVSNGAAVCAYADYGTCYNAASQQRGACVQADPRIPAQQPNPYSSFNGR